MACLPEALCGQICLFNVYTFVWRVYVYMYVCLAYMYLFTCVYVRLFGVHVLTFLFNARGVWSTWGPCVADAYLSPRQWRAYSLEALGPLPTNSLKDHHHHSFTLQYVEKDRNKGGESEPGRQPEPKPDSEHRL